MNGCKWNSKIKEYYILNGKLRLKGEYLNWKIYGKGKEYDYEEKILFEGEYKIGKRNEKEKNMKMENYYLNGEIFKWRNK